MGYLPEAIGNYLLRLGWSHGDDEFISQGQAIAWFDLDAVGKSPARFDFDKLDSLSGHYLKLAEDGRLIDLLRPRLAEALGRELSATELTRLGLAMPVLKPRAKTLQTLGEATGFCVAMRPLELDDKASKLLSDETRPLMSQLSEALRALPEWSAEALETAIKAFVERENLKLGQIAQPLRAALTGRAASPGIYDVLTVLGREESLSRIADQAA